MTPIFAHLKAEIILIVFVCVCACACLEGPCLYSLLFWVHLLLICDCCWFRRGVVTLLFVWCALLQICEGLSGMLVLWEAFVWSLYLRYLHIFWYVLPRIKIIIHVSCICIYTHTRIIVVVYSDLLSHDLLTIIKTGSQYLRYFTWPFFFLIFLINFFGCVQACYCIPSLTEMCKDSTFLP